MDRLLRARLLALERKDQLARSGMRFRRTDRVNANALRRIIGECGWPTIRAVGVRAAAAAWLIAQHADHDVGFQKRCLTLMRAAARERQADPQLVAYLTDRVLVNGGRPQVYGTQFYRDEEGMMRPRPIRDKSGLPGRRRALGLKPLGEYQRSLSVRQAALDKKLARPRTA